MADNQYFSVIYEDNHLIVVNKSAGLLVQADESGDITLLDLVKEYLREKSKKTGEAYCGLPHRLDRPVSGLVVMTKTSKALARMNKIFSTRAIEKTYWAVVGQRPEPNAGNLVHWLAKDRTKNTVRAYRKEVADSQQSELDYELLRTINGKYILEVQPVTGRPHQIRVQLASLGCPIVGDLKYGYKTANSDKSILLHARAIRFQHPVRKVEVYFEAELPRNLVWADVRSTMPKAIASPLPLLGTDRDSNEELE